MVRMIKGKYVITGFLLLVSLLAATQTVQSQQYTTTTFTTFATSSQVNTVTVGTQVMTTTSGQATPVYVGPPIMILGTHGVCGEYFEQTFNATAGESLTGSVSSSRAVNVYVMTSTGFQMWQHQVVAGGTCIPSTSLASQANTTSYTLSTTIPVNGTYDLVVNNLSESTVTAQITANLTEAAPSLVTSVAYSTATQQMAQTLTQTSVLTLQTTTSSGPGTATLAGLIFVIVIIAVAAYLAKTKRGKTAKN